MGNNVISIGTKCNAKLYEELKPILESFGYNKYDSYYAIDDWDEYPYLIVGYYTQHDFGNYLNNNEFKILSKEEFLKQAAAIMGKEYTSKSNKENIENKENMKNKYPVIKCDEKLWNEIKPVLESFGIINYVIDRSDLISENCFLLSNYGSPKINALRIGTIRCGNVNYYNSELRYVVNTKEEFLSAVAKLLGKEYPIKEKQIDKRIKYPCIKCSKKLYDKIKDILNVIGYNIKFIDKFKEYDKYLTVNKTDVFGNIKNPFDKINSINLYVCSNIKDFLTAACELKGFTVSYINNTEDNNFENHYFGYCINSDNKTIGIYENFENEVSNINPFTSESNNTEKDNKNKENMEKINIAEKLKHCKKGTKLYCILHGIVEFNHINKEDNAICFSIINKSGNKVDRYLNEYGSIFEYPGCECLLFPSKDNRDWNNFNVLEKGHLVMCADYCDAWQLRKYVSGHIAGFINSKFETESGAWKYIVPIEDFDFTAEDISINKEKSII